MPVAVTEVPIGKGMDVVLDASTPALRSLAINGTHCFANNADLERTTEWIMLHRELEIGSEAIPHTQGDNYPLLGCHL